MNNNMKSSIKTVTTVSGKTIPKEKTRLIDGLYYEIGDCKIENSGDCYLINDKYYRAETGYICYDHRKMEYSVMNQSNFIKGVVGFNENKEPIIGYFSSIPLKREIAIKVGNNMYSLMNEDIVLNSNYMESLADGVYYIRSSKIATTFVKPAFCDMVHKNRLPYDSRGIISKKTNIYNALKSEREISANAKEYGGCLKDLTFGVEFETNKGYIPPRICDKLGLIALRDGSIEGLEFVTIPLKGDDGLQSLIDSTKELKKRTTYDNGCSLHLHIGNVPRTEEFILALYKTLCFVQDEIFELFPLYKKYNFGYKRKHYTKPLNLNRTILMMDKSINDDNIKENFGILFDELSMGIPYSNYSNDLNKVFYHPSDPNGESKWNIKSRYTAFNLIPLIFGNKQTVEFRLHTPTYDVNKIINYLFICSNIINFVKMNTNSILTNPMVLRDINLNDIMYSVNIKNRLVDNISTYIQDRKSFVFNKNRNSEIHFNEDEYDFRRSSIDWDGKSKINSLSGLHQSALNRFLEQVGDRIHDEAPRFRPFIDPIEDPFNGIVEGIEEVGNNDDDDDDDDNW